MTFVPRPAPLSKRVIAGLIDAAFIVVLSGISFVAPLVLRGLVLPMWGVLAVMVGYAVVPLAFLKRTLGLHIMGLELVGKRGHALDLANASFRELLGRGYFPAAYLFTIVAGLVASAFHVGSNTSPPLLAGVMTLACSAAFAVAVIGHVVALGRPDQRTLADLLSGSFVVEGQALLPPSDLEDFDDFQAHRRGVLRNLAVFEVLLMVSVIALPWLLSSSSGESPQMKGQRLKLEALQAKFNANPGSDSLANELQRELQRAGRREELQAVSEKHAQALGRKEAEREQRLREDFTAKHDRTTAEALISLLEQQDRVDEAKELYLDWLGPSPTASQLTGFGNWLATNTRTDEAVTVLSQATTMDPLVPYGRTLLGVSLQRLGRLTAAREQLELALLEDPTDEDAADALRDVEAQAGVLPPSGKEALRRQFEAWRRDAGPR